MSESLESSGSSLLFLGRHGMGKSHALRQLCAHAREAGARVCSLALAPGLELAESLAAVLGRPSAGPRATLLQAGRLAQQTRRNLVVCIDELHHLSRRDAAELAAALEECVQLRLPVRVLAAALPSIEQRLGPMFSLLCRLAARIELAPLRDTAAASLLIGVAAPRGRKFAASALGVLMQRCEGVPQFLDCWARLLCAVATEAIIRQSDLAAAEARVRSELDAGFFSAPLRGLGVAERAYLLAMAELGDAPQRSGAIASRLGRPVTAVAPLRAMLINKHLLHAPDYGWTAYTTPQHAAYLRRMDVARSTGDPDQPGAEFSADSMSSASIAGASFGA